MLLTPHALVGATIGASTDNIYLIIILAIISHFVLDLLPHFDWATWHEHDKNKEGEFKLELKDYLLVTFDGLLMLMLIYGIWTNHDKNVLILVGSLMAILVDLIDAVPFWNKIVRKYYLFNKLHNLHKKIQYQLKAKYWYWGVVTQIIIIMIMLNYLSYR